MNWGKGKGVFNASFCWTPLASRKKVGQLGIEGALKEREVGWCRMALVGKPMGTQSQGGCGIDESQH